MADFTTIASDVISDTKISGDINASLAKIASTHNFNKEESQRLVEETNIAIFLDKMQDGTQHEDYELASPVSTSSPSTNGGDGSLGKIASDGVGYFFATPDMYDISIHSDPLMKTASNIDMSDIDLPNMDSIKKWERDALVKREHRLSELEKEAEVKNNMAIDNFIANLSHAIKGDPDLVKTALALTHPDNIDFTDSVLSDTHFKIDEIISSEITTDSINRLDKLASEKWEESLFKVAGTKETIEDGKKALNGMGNILKFPFKNPRTTVGVLGSAYVVHKSMSGDKELDERRKMMKIDKENNNA